MSELVQAILVGAAGGAILSLAVPPVAAAMLKKRGLEPAERKRPWLLPLLMFTAGGLLGWRAGLSWRLLYMELMLLAAALIAKIDADRRIIPNELVLAIMALTGLFGALGLIEFNIWSSLLGFAVCFVLFMAPALMQKQVGAGDVKLAAAMGFCTGFTGSMVAVAIMGGLVLLYTLCERQAPFLQTVKRMIPMGPFLAAALLIVQAV